jgi:hypothetical protein
MERATKDPVLYRYCGNRTGNLQKCIDGAPCSTNYCKSIQQKCADFMKSVDEKRTSHAIPLNIKKAYDDARNIRRRAESVLKAGNIKRSPQSQIENTSPFSKKSPSRNSISARSNISPSEIQRLCREKLAI